ncbi:BAAT / Acyl-CoA thioester hydrolase C terminal [Mucilaginibacter lappiensis]|uniref:Dienelactone hydrolase n=1 Tax=Mucilaginibacter lappiensis TaxID=354630 RepID=A0ABR6PPD9_9SPHI|nr:dienelactone hydrolase family protein [Mucilaginibacter lappiensis]MBB6111623.1 dienelactone hydrolase [Mucilaginibacter lappiensis]SIR84397.1 BAAT / Acyl-CoA thioester hydrolase C terminal [Mucilaginibacter lappiensis]
MPVTPQEYSFKEYVIQQNQETIRFYIHTPGFSPEKSTFLFLQGSGAVPLCMENDQGHRLTFSLHNRPEIVQDFNFVIISKAGFTFSRHQDAAAPAEYHQKTSLAYRVFQADTVLRYLQSNQLISNKHILVCGHSEGSDVAAKLATANKDISHLAFLSGGGASQFLEYFLYIRKRITRGELSFREGQQEIEILTKQFEEMMQSPTSTNKFWQGHTYLRWATFAESALRNLLHLNIPIFMAMGSQDPVVHPETFDLIISEFLFNKKQNLHHQIYEGADHAFKEKSDTGPGIDHIPQLITDMVNWFHQTLIA